jgi:hypothetical protein
MELLINADGLLCFQISISSFFYFIDPIVFGSSKKSRFNFRTGTNYNLFFDRKFDEMSKVWYHKSSLQNYMHLPTLI